MPYHTIPYHTYHTIPLLNDCADVCALVTRYFQILSTPKKVTEAEFDLFFARAGNGPLT